MAFEPVTPAYCCAYQGCRNLPYGEMICAEHLKAAIEDNIARRRARGENTFDAERELAEVLAWKEAA